MLVTTAVRLPAAGCAVKVTTIWDGLDVVTFPVAPRLKATVLFAFAEAKPKPLMVTVVAVERIFVVFETTTGIAVATCTAAPLEPPPFVTTAVRAPTGSRLVSGFAPVVVKKS